MINAQNILALRRRRGIALVLVITVMAVAAVMGYAMLSSSALQGTASANAINAAVADAQAQSGIQLAMYYLQNPGNAPAGFFSGSPVTTTFASTTGQPSVPGSVTITVTSSGTNTYTVAAVGSSSGSTTGGGAITRTISSAMKVNMVYLINQAAGCNSALSIPADSTFSSSETAIKSTGVVTIAAGSSVTGNISAPSVANHGTYNGSTSAAPSGNASPTLGDLHDYRTYVYQGTTYTAQALAGSGTLTLNNVNLVPDPQLNPLGVFWYSGNVIMSSNVNITGTLIVKSGKLTLTGKSNTIVAQTNMPALLIDQTLSVTNGNALSVTGIVWAGQGIKGSGATAGTNLQINGALLIDTGGISGLLASGTLNVQYNPAVVSVPDLSSANQTPQSAQITSWVQ